MDSSGSGYEPVEGSGFINGGEFHEHLNDY
jgi:hypothetical protein